MAKHFLLWSNENVYYELKLPSKTTIGRGDTNMIQLLDHKTVSTNHATIIIEDSLINPLDYTCWIEDHNSRNGTFAGITPSLEDFEKVNGKRKLIFGDYLRFGSSSFYRFLEFPPPLAPNAPEPVKEIIKSKPIVKEEIIRPISKTNLFNTSQNNLKESMRDSKNIVINNDKDNKDENKNMSILINYGSNSFERPITVVVDPISPSKQDHNNTENNYRNNRQDSPSNEYKNKNKRYDDFNHYNERYNGIEEEYVEQDYSDDIKNIQKKIPSNRNTNTNNTSLNFADNNIKKLPLQLLYSHDENSSHSNNNKDLQLDNTLDELIRQEFGERVDLGHTNYSNDYNNNNIDNSNNNSNMFDSKDFQFPGGSTSFDMKSSKINFPKFKNKKEKNINRQKNIPHSQLEDLNIPSSSDVDHIVNSIIGILYKYKIGDNEKFSYTLIKNIKSSMSTNEKFTDIINSSKLTSNKETQKILAEILVENMQDDNEITVSYQLNEVINNLNNLLKQSRTGMSIKQDLQTSIATSVEFNGILDEMLKSMVSDSIDILKNVQSSHLFYALRTSNENGYDQFDKIIENSIERLEKLLLFQNKQYLIEEYAKLSQIELYEVDSFVYSIIVEEVDFVSRIINRIVQLTFGNVIKPSLSNSNSPMMRSSTNVRNMLSTEVEEMRMIKNKQASNLNSKQMTNLLNNKAITKKNTELKSFFFHALKKILKNESKLIYRLVKPYENMIIGIIRKSFLRWERYHTNMKLIETLAKVEDETILQRENSKLKCDNYFVNSKIHKLERNSDTLTSLQAEKSLNRELLEINRELRVSIQELELKLLDICEGPKEKSSRKLLVKDVLFDREDEIVNARRQLDIANNSLTRLQDQIKDPQLVQPSQLNPINIRNNNNNNNNNDPINNNSIPNKVLNNNHSNLIRNANTELTKNKFLNKKNYNLNEKLTPSRSEMSKSVAKQVVLQEVRRMHLSYLELKENRKKLCNDLIQETAKNTQLSSSLQYFQNKLIIKERSQNILNILLHERLGDKGIRQLLDKLYELGAETDFLHIPTLTAFTNIERNNNDNNNSKTNLNNNNSNYFLNKNISENLFEEGTEIETLNDHQFESNNNDINIDDTSLIIEKNDQNFNNNNSNPNMLSAEEYRMSVTKAIFE